jgi:hypothetical protein
VAKECKAMKRIISFTVIGFHVFATSSFAQTVRAGFSVTTINDKKTPVVSTIYVNDKEIYRLIGSTDAEGKFKNPEKCQQGMLIKVKPDNKKYFESKPVACQTKIVIVLNRRDQPSVAGLLEDVPAAVSNVSGESLANTGASSVTAKKPKQAKATKAQKLQEVAVTDVPRCTRKLGTLSITDGDDPIGWMQYGLQSPTKLLKALVQRSGCFNLVDRGTGLNAAQRERDIGGNLGLQRKSNVGQGQIKAADYVLVAEIQGANSNASGSAVGGGLGAVVSGLLGGLKTKKLEANTVLSLTNVWTTETLAAVDGYAVKKDTSSGAGGFFGAGNVGAGAIGGGYESTDIGRIVTLSFIQAYSKMVTDLGLVTPSAVGTAEAAPAKTFTAQTPAAMRKTAAPGGAVIRMLPAGAIVYPTGNKNGLFWEVADENDNTGWVLNTKLAPLEKGEALKNRPVGDSVGIQPTDSRGSILFLPRREVVQPISRPSHDGYPPCSKITLDYCTGS